MMSVRSSFSSLGSFSLLEMQLKALEELLYMGIGDW